MCLLEIFVNIKIWNITNKNNLETLYKSFYIDLLPYLLNNVLWFNVELLRIYAFYTWCLNLEREGIWRFMKIEKVFSHKITERKIKRLFLAALCVVRSEERT